MAKILENMYRALGLGFVLTIVIFAVVHGKQVGDAQFWQFLVRWVHVLFGILWIGLLWYFNFVQIPTMPKVPAELKKGVSGYIAPEALFWFRWSALGTVIAGLVLAHLNAQYGIKVLWTFSSPMVGIGMWLGLIMAANVWFVIWPNQQRALGLVPADDASKAKSARMAMLASRTNFVLSVPMLYCMVAQQNIA